MTMNTSEKNRNSIGFTKLLLTQLRVPAAGPQLLVLLSEGAAGAEGMHTAVLAGGLRQQVLLAQAVAEAWQRGIV